MTKKLQADIHKEILNIINKLRKEKKIDRDTLLTVILYKGIESIKTFEKNKIIKEYLDIIEKIDN